MKVDSMQTTIFTQLADAAASDLLAMLNDGRKIKYQPEWSWQEGVYHIYMVAASKTDYLFNVVDDMGNVPTGFPVNWRSLQHIRHELKLYER